MFYFSQIMIIIMHLTNRVSLSSKMLFILIVYIMVNMVHVNGSATMQVELKTRWNTSGILMEVGEYVTSIDEHIYWEYLTRLSHETLPLERTDRGEYEVAIRVAESLIDDSSTIDSVRYSLAIHTFAPKAHLMRNVAFEDIVRKMDGNKSKLDELEGCALLLSYGKEVLCVRNVEDLNRLASASTHNGSTEYDDLEQISGDHQSPNCPTVKTAPSVVLYADLYDPSGLLFEVHRKLTHMCEKGNFRYTFRPLTEPLKFAQSPFWKPNATPQYGMRQTGLSMYGFGVELVIKNMEYKVIDDAALDLGGDDIPAELNEDQGDIESVGGFFFEVLKKRHATVKEQLNEFRAELLNHTSKIERTNVWELHNLGIQATQTIVKSENPLVLAEDIGQKFPMFANSLSRIRVNDSVAEEVKRFQELGAFEAGSNHLFINGIPLDADTVDVFALDELVRSETSSVRSLRSVGLHGSTIDKLLALSNSFDSSNQQSGLHRVHVPTTTKDGFTAWMNNLEDGKDPRYQEWSPSVRELLSPGWPNQLRYIRKNLYTGVVLVDPTDSEELALFARAKFFVEANAPIRVGVMLRCREQQQKSSPLSQQSLDVYFSDDTWSSTRELLLSDEKPKDSSSTEFSECDRAMRLFWHIHEHKSSSDAMNYLIQLEDTLRTHKKLTRGNINAHFRRAMNLDRDESKKLARQLDTDATLTRIISDTLHFVQLAGIGNSNFIVNGVPSNANEDLFREVMMTRIIQDQMFFRQQVYLNRVSDRTDFNSYWSVDNDRAYIRVNEHIVSSSRDAHIEFAHNLPTVFKTDMVAPSFIRPLHQTDKTVTTEGRVATHHYVVMCNVATTHGLKLASAAVDYLLLKSKSGSSSSDDFVRMLIVPYVPKSNTDGSGVYNALRRILWAIRTDEERVGSKRVFNSRKDGLEWLKRALMLASAFRQKNVTQSSQVDTWNRVLKESGTAASSSFDERKWESFALSCVSTMNIDEGHSALVHNGRQIAVDKTFMVDVYDFSLLDKLSESSKVWNTVSNIVGGAELSGYSGDDLTSDVINDAVMVAGWIVHRRSEKSRLSHSSVRLPTSISGRCAANCFQVASSGDDNKAFLKVDAVLDPLSKGGQHLTGMLVSLHSMFSTKLTVYLNPATDISELPLQRFYRVAVPRSLDFDDRGKLVASRGAVFHRIRSKNVLSFNVHTPEAWLVQSTVAAADLDNLRLEELGGKPLHVELQLESILLAGRCVDVERGDPPSGLRLMLSKPTNPHVTDTVVLQNLGYFQMQADAGIWVMSFMGKGLDLYEFVDASHTQSFAVSKFNQEMQVLTVKRREGTEHEDLLAGDSGDVDSATKNGGVWNRVANYFGGPRPVEKNTDDVVNVFSIASGHLYERFLKIMMLSVLKNTKSKLKFWFLKEFLSPQFKAFVPKFAKHYGFEVELISYKWPQWLRRQSVKMRTIWGHKILFLDTLFPLSLHRVIFVDADQVVRGDIKELWDMDLRGAPYGYTPFCDSNKETEGFRFWKGGYWKQHLRGKPYHISALYVVDLDRFRAMRAGDTLRAIYDNLSRDENSLSNLDQDLPNYAQHNVPIYSLPQPWLWCQTWCSMDTLSEAKTIDLCNNPLTKQPKLDVARSLLPEWNELDEEASRFKVTTPPVAHTDL